MIYDYHINEKKNVLKVSSAERLGLELIRVWLIRYRFWLISFWFSVSWFDYFFCKFWFSFIKLILFVN